jgi:hypothetical protein
LQYAGTAAGLLSTGDSRVRGIVTNSRPEVMVDGVGGADDRLNETF